VQLIEQATLRREPPRNWCYYEYTRFSENRAIVDRMGDKDRHYFILTGPLSEIEPVNRVRRYNDWIQRVGRVRCDDISISKVKEKATLRSKMRVIAEQILKLRNEIIESWLS
jgi:hypothetical protein